MEMVSSQGELNPESIDASIKTSNISVGGALVISVGLVALVQAILILLRASPESIWPFTPKAYGLVKMMAYIGVAASLFAIIGGAMATMRRYYIVAVSGGFVSVFVGGAFLFFVGGVVGVIGLYLISDRGEYKSKSQEDKAFAALLSER
jgi:hypothetical protein